jgi:hypothetical protein
VSLNPGREDCWIAGLLDCWIAGIPVVNIWSKIYILVLQYLSNFDRVRRVRVNNEHLILFTVIRSRPGGSFFKNRTVESDLVYVIGRKVHILEICLPERRTPEPSAGGWRMYIYPGRYWDAIPEKILLICLTYFDFSQPLHLLSYPLLLKHLNDMFISSINRTEDGGALLHPQRPQYGGHSRRTWISLWSWCNRSANTIQMAQRLRSRENGVFRWCATWETPPE